MHPLFRNVNWKLKYNIEFKGLKEGVHEFDFDVDKKFFGYFEGSLVNKGEAKINVLLEKRSTFIKIHLKINGLVELVCDRCLENYMQEVTNEAELFVKFGEESFDEDENVIWVLPEEHAINLAQPIYEYLSLGIPMRHIHPKNENGKRKCNLEMLKKLKKFMYSTEDEDESTDPRWDALKKLRNNN
ncbi:MAG: DUF177 domain-containing protein [Prolixibacteraceae bacterium]|nr:DUF177 domain-containing protein [Prolixibacteraceae bacterium]